MEEMFSRKFCHLVLLGLVLFNASCASVKGQRGTATVSSQAPVPIVTATSEPSGRVELTAYVEQSGTAVLSDLTDPSLPPADDPLSIPPSAPEAIPPELAVEKQPEPSLPDSIEPQTGRLLDTDHELPINLCTALKLANARPVVIAAAQASAWVAEAKLQRARLLWIPEFDIGSIYLRHDGYGPDFNRGVNNPSFGGPTPGGPLNNNFNWFYGYGSFYQSVNVADAIFQPLVARQVLDAERTEIQTAKNDALLATANAYFDVHQYRGQYAGALDVVDRSQKLVDRISKLSEDLVPKVELNRSLRMQATMLQKAASAREQWRVSSANLTQVLRLDPTAVVVPMEPDHLQITLIDPARPLDEMITIAVTHRPEIVANKAKVRATEQQVRLEKHRPLLPLVLITGFQGPGGMRSQFGIFGQGADGSLNNWSLREDVSLQLVWQLDEFGFGNLARIKEQRGLQSQAIVRLFKYQDTVAAEVTAAQARVQSAAVRAVQAERELREAIVTFDGNYDGLAQTTRFDNVLHQVFRPQEAVKSLERLMESYNTYFATIAEYNRAQFELYHALGYPAKDVTDLQMMGETIDVNSERPFGLPVVESGPPAADR